ncbi:MAG: hypothetical protein IT372_20455 [Polyangiaceae bacterium]|nr:hypothetical protein [Polyangiaceae bacterium]
MRPAWAGPGDFQAARGIALARKGDCAKAVPLLEEAELKRHRPSSAVALADCYVAQAELIRASELYHAVAGEKMARGFTFADRIAIKKAKKKAADVDKRIPTIAFEPEEDYEDLEVELEGRVMDDPAKPRKVLPDTKIPYQARARGYEELADEIVLSEGERRVVKLKLKLLPPPPKKPPERRPGSGRPTTWIGAGYQGFVIPKLMFNLFGDGGRTMLVPGGELTLTTQASDVDVVISLAYARFRLGETPFRPDGQPDTEWEILESDLQALMATAHLAWDFPLNDSGSVSFRVGAGAGVGWTFLGNLYRTQAYPPKGAGGDPYKYKKCRGPNDPAGSFLYCNQLDHDADHYFGYVEPSWFEGGYSPLIFPWLSLPELGLTGRPSDSVAIDLKVGLSITGLLTSLGVRFGL